MGSPRPLMAEDYEVLRWLTGEFQMAREVAAALHGKGIQEVIDSGESAEIARILQRLRAWGYAERDYHYESGQGSGRCCYRLTAKGREWLLMGQAA